ncbi:GTPase Era [Effusibacillus lacus]|uniref:GTPase Era n=1 Tax=Effusibacillus lacus TaxID=1348429 RepID=A0A292YRG6_9BACL|nr:GTPase Era [Effusibacillus lacus]TCS70357.1 GTP-binding protein Era [Effusibacillus lacus]GAX91511.1 GTPase Era [Effusibacillus lacus]
MTQAIHKSGFIALVGRPNVGKSTLLNQIVGQKVAIMSDRPQTTRNRIRGVYTTDEGQAIFLDTPGIHKPQHKLGDYMVRTAIATFGEVDLICMIVDASEKKGPGDEFVIEQLKKVNTPVFLLVNKIDSVSHDKLLEIIADYKDLYPFKEIVPISALTGDNVDRLRSLIFANLPEGPQYYPDDQVTDHPERFVVAELIREKVLHLTREEVPHSVAVEIEQMQYREDKDLLYISAVIYTERTSQKGILIGKSGGMLKEIGQRARTDIENLFGSRAFLELWVKVKEDWRNRETMLRNFGFTDTD